MRVSTRISEQAARRLTAKKRVVHPIGAVMQKFGVPLILVIGAAALVFGYLVVMLLGWRDYAGLLSGTYVSDDHTFDMLRCGAFLGLYFGAVVVAPILVIAAPVWSLLNRSIA